MAGRRCRVTESVLGRLREALGGLAMERDRDGRPRLAPEREEDLAALLSLATAEGWRVRVEGRGSWCPPDAPADVVVTTAALDRIRSVAPADLVATVGTGTSLATLSSRLSEDGVWLAWDPPGRPDRSVGGVIASGTAGPLRHRFGPVRDHLLGCTLVTGDGRIIRAGGTVVKNVAGYDLTRLMAGGFGAFGVVTEVHLRLRAIPEADRTLVAHGARDDLTRAGRDLIESGIDAAALELLSPAVAAHPEWTLAVRLLGTRDGAAAEAARLHRLAELQWVELGPEPAGALWHGAAQAMLAGPVSIRLGVLLEGLDDTLDLVSDRLDAGLVTAGGGSGSVRWTGDPSLEALLDLRQLLAAREIPLTLERAPWSLRMAFGHFGRYREGVGLLVGRLRDTFDPGRVLVVPLDSELDG